MVDRNLDNAHIPLWVWTTLLYDDNPFHDNAILAKLCVLYNEIPTNTITEITQRKLRLIRGYIGIRMFLKKPRLIHTEVLLKLDGEPTVHW